MALPAALTRKAGPLAVWQWGALAGVGAVGIVWWRKRKAAASGAPSATGASAQAVPQYGAPFGGAGGLGDMGGGAGGSSSNGGSLPPPAPPPSGGGAGSSAGFPLGPGATWSPVSSFSPAQNKAEQSYGGGSVYNPNTGFYGYAVPGVTPSAPKTLGQALAGGGAVGEQYGYSYDMTSAYNAGASSGIPGQPGFVGISYSPGNPSGPAATTSASAVPVR